MDRERSVDTQFSHVDWADRNLFASKYPIPLIYVMLFACCPHNRLSDNKKVKLRETDSHIHKGRERERDGER